MLQFPFVQMIYNKSLSLCLDSIPPIPIVLTLLQLYVTLAWLTTLKSLFYSKLLSLRVIMEYAINCTLRKSNMALPLPCLVFSVECQCSQVKKKLCLQNASWDLYFFRYSLGYSPSHCTRHYYDAMLPSRDLRTVSTLSFPWDTYLRSRSALHTQTCID